MSFLASAFGRNADIDSGTLPEDVWQGSGAYTFLSAVETLRLSSGDADDRDKGAGAQVVVIEGLDASGLQQSEEVTLNGATVVLSANQYLRVNRVWVKEAGTSGTNEGAITVTGGAATLAVIPAGLGTSLAAIYSTPSTDFARTVLLGWTATVANVAAVECGLSIQVRERGTGGFHAEDFRTLDLNAPHFDHQFAGGILIPNGSDVRVRVHTLTADDVEVAAGFQIAMD